jgi:Cu/Ag efflux protein CusF
VEPTSADARSHLAPRDEDQAAEPPAERRAVDRFLEIHQMKAWKVVLLLNLALLVGLGAGYLWWGRQVVRLQRDLVAARLVSAGIEREWKVNGVVRAILPELDVVVITHEELPGYMAPMTMGFRVAAPKIYEGIQIGDAVRFTVRGAPPNVKIIALEKVAS